MELVGDSERIAASLADRIDRLTFADLEAEQVTALLVDTVVAWATGSGWRAYRRAPSVVPLPPPYQNRQSCVDVGCARPAGAPVVVEVDNSDRQRSVDKLLAEAGAGRIPLWVRWGTGRFESPPPPVEMVTCPVTVRRDLGTRRRLYSRVPSCDRPAPSHTSAQAVADRQSGLFEGIVDAKS
jgi:hypothetical protein